MNSSLNYPMIKNWYIYVVSTTEKSFFYLYEFQNCYGIK